jgi:hypothetical protein
MPLCLRLYGGIKIHLKNTFAFVKLEKLELVCNELVLLSAKKFSNRKSSSWLGKNLQTHEYLSVS